MLIQKPLAKNDVVTCKLLTGEELIATYESETDTVLTVHKPATLAQGPQGMGIIPWMMSAKADKIELNKNTVIATAPTDEEIAKAYTQATTDIQLVT